MPERAHLDRRQFLIVTGAGAAAAAADSAALGCASLPRRGAEPTAHPCRHRHCRYFHAASGGRCGLGPRVAGGVP